MKDQGRGMTTFFLGEKEKNQRRGERCLIIVRRCVKPTAHGPQLLYQSAMKWRASEQRQGCLGAKVAVNVEMGKEVKRLIT